MAVRMKSTRVTQTSAAFNSFMRYCCTASDLIAIELGQGRLSARESKSTGLLH